MVKYKVPVYAIATASMFVGEVECDTYEEYLKKRDELFEENEPHFPNYACNPFDLGDADFEDFDEKDMKYYKIK